MDIGFGGKGLHPLRVLLLAAVLSGCGQLPAEWSSAKGASGVTAMAKVPQPGNLSGHITIDSLTTPFLKDPSIVDNGNPVGNTRYVAFGDLRNFYLKGFDLVGGVSVGPVTRRPASLRFHPGEIPIVIAGRPAKLDAHWAPALFRLGDRMVLLYCAGEMPPPHPPRWATFRLRMATLPFADLVRELQSGAKVEFQDRGAILDDPDPFGSGDRDFGMIDPQYYVNPQGRAFVTYTVVRYGIDGVRPHEEFVRYREVSPSNPATPIGPDSPLYDGLTGPTDEGVAEAQEVVTMGDKSYAIISSRPSDSDQRLMVAEVPSTLGYLSQGALKPLIDPGGSGWEARSVGSSGTAVINGTAYMVYQGLDVSGHFTLGWCTLGL